MSDEEKQELIKLLKRLSDEVNRLENGLAMVAESTYKIKVLEHQIKRMTH